MTVARGIVVPLRVDRKGFIASMNAASMSMGRFQTQMASYSRGIQNMMTFSVAIIGIQALKGLNRAYRDVEDRLLSVEAKTRASTDSMKKLKNEIIEISRISPKTTAEIALFAETQAKMGFTTKQIRDQVRGTVMASTATGSSMEHIGFAGGALQRGLGLDSAHFQRISDLLVAAVNNSAATIEELMVTFRYAVAAVPGLGLTLEEAMALVMGLYNVNVKGSVAGTAFRSGFAALIRGTEEVTNLSSDFEKSVRKGTKILAKYGLSIRKDPETGNISNFMEILQTLREAKDGKGAPLEDYMYLFGTRAGPYWAAMTNLTEEAWQHILDAVASAQGIGKKTFDKMMQSTTKQWELVGAKWDVLQQRMSDAGLILVERKVIRFLQDLLDTLDKYVPALAAVVTALAPFLLAISGLLLFNVLARVILFALSPLTRFVVIIWQGARAMTKIKALRFVATLSSWTRFFSALAIAAAVVWFVFALIWTLISDFMQMMDSKGSPLEKAAPDEKTIHRMETYANIMEGIGKSFRKILDLGFKVAKAISYVGLEVSLFLKPTSRGVINAINAPLSKKVELIRDAHKSRKEWEESWAQREKDWEKALGIGGKLAYDNIPRVGPVLGKYYRKYISPSVGPYEHRRAAIGPVQHNGTIRSYPGAKEWVSGVMTRPFRDVFGELARQGGVPEWMAALAEGRSTKQVELGDIFPGLYGPGSEPLTVTDAEYEKELEEIEKGIADTKNGGKKKKTKEELEAERKAAEEQAAKENRQMRWDNLAASTQPYANKTAEAIKMLQEKYGDIKKATKDEMKVVNDLIWNDLERVMQMAVRHSKKMAKALALIRLKEAYISIQTGIANAMALPFPQNLAAASVVAIEGWAVYKDLRQAVKGQAHDGLTNVPRTGTYILEGGEAVIKRRQNEQLQRFLDNQMSQPQQIIQVMPNRKRGGLHLDRTELEDLNNQLMELSNSGKVNLRRAVVA